MPNPGLVQKRMQEKAQRDKDRLNAAHNIRQVEALELIADTLVDLNDAIAEIRATLIGISFKIK